MELAKYWREVNDCAEKLPDQDVYYLTSLEHPEKGTTAGRVCDMTNKKEVARRLVEKTHRMAKPEEIERFHADQKRQTEELAAIELKRKQQFALPQDLQVLVAAAAKAVMADGEGPKKKEK